MELERFIDAAGRLLRLIEESPLPTPDRVSYFASTEQLQVYWREQNYGPVFDLERFDPRNLAATQTLRDAG
jgi:hypothetical protein